MLESASPQLVIVPGVGDSGPEHWQTWLERRAPKATRVLQADWNMPVREEWVQALALHLAKIDEPVLLVGHSAGAVTIVHWAATHAQRRGIAGALLVAPADLEVDLPDGTPVEFLADAGWVPCPRSRLPFPSVLVASSNDPFATMPRSEEMARAWGSRLLRLDGAGHINADAGYGAWPAAEAILADLSTKKLGSDPDSAGGQ